MSPRTHANNPYKGPFPFNVGDELCGRDGEILALLNRLLADRVVLLYAVSGAGKTSLLQAGLIPRLGWRRFEHLGPIRVSSELPAGTPGNRYLAGALQSLKEGLAKAKKQVPEAVTGETLDGNLRRVAASAGIHSGVLLFDQFEELLTLDPTDRDRKEEFFDQLGKVLALPDGEGRTWWAVFAMREDYVPALEPYLWRLPTRLDSRLRLELLGLEAAAEAIRVPAAGAGVRFEKAALEKLVKDLSTVQVMDLSGRAMKKEGLYVEPVLLQVTARLLWPKWARLGEVREEHLPERGGVSRTLERFYRLQVRAAARATNVSERAIREWVQERLITEQNLRGQVQQGMGASAGMSDRVIDLLVRRYLLRREQRHGTIWFELAHDRLTDPITRDNDRWLKKHLTNFQAQARVWHRRGQPTELLAPPELLRGWEQPGRSGEPLTEVESAYLARSRQAWGKEEEERRTRQRLGFLFWELAEAGWGVIFPQKAEEPLRAALAPLLELRRGQAAARQPGRYKVFFGPDGHRPGETVWQFLARHGAGTTGPPNPDRMPYYLLIVGDPPTIPLEFQYYLDVQYGVGRIFFETRDEYADYARGVVAAETAPPRPRRVVLFAPRHPGDPKTEAMTRNLIEPLAANLGAEGWCQVELIAGEPATKARWREVLADAPATKARWREVLADAPALLLAAGHGVFFPPGDARWRVDQGALLCQDWPGPEALGKRALEPAHYFTAAEAGAARLRGCVALLYHDFSAASPPQDVDPRLGLSTPAAWGSSPGRPRPPPLYPAFLSRLPQRLLAHGDDGALAVIGRADRFWQHPSGEELTAFISVLRRLMAGHPVGAAVEFFNARYGELATRLAAVVEEGAGSLALSSVLDSLRDARNYLVLGDPAVRLRLAEAPLE